MVLIAWMLACIGTASPYRASTPTPVATAITMASPEQIQDVSVPPQIATAISETLMARNLTHQPIRPTETFDAMGTTQQRMMWLAGRSGAANILLVESTVRPMGHIGGRYRWGVEVTITLAPGGDPARAINESFTIPITLSQVHEQEPDALTAAAPQIARRVGLLYDRYMRGVERAR